MDFVEEGLEQEFLADLTRLHQEGIRIDLSLDVADAWSLLGHLQLALGHPDNQGAASDRVREIARTVERQIALTPALRKVAAMGWRYPSPGGI